MIGIGKQEMKKKKKVTEYDNSIKIIYYVFIDTRILQITHCLYQNRIIVERLSCASSSSFFFSLIACDCYYYRMWHFVFVFVALYFYVSNDASIQ